MSPASSLRVADQCLGDQQVAMAMAAFSSRPARLDEWRVPSRSAWRGTPQPDSQTCPYCDGDGYKVTFEQQAAGILMKAECATCGVRAERFVTGWRPPRS